MRTVALTFALTISAILLASPAPAQANGSLAHEGARRAPDRPEHHQRTAAHPRTILYALDLSTGAILARYDPSDDDPAAVGSLTSPAIGANGTIYVGVRGRFGPRGVNGRVLAVDYDEAMQRFSRRWAYEVEGHIEWNHPAIGTDGGLYIGSTTNAFTGSTLQVFPAEGVPEGTTCTFYGLKDGERRSR